MLFRSQDLVRIMIAEQGKPLAEALGEVAYGASFVQWFAEQARRASGEMPAAPAPGQRLLVMRQPIG